MRRLLVANRGEIACRVLRTARRLGLDTVAVFSDADADAPHVAAADAAVRLPGTASADTYLDAGAVLAAAARAGADAVHPGYGFLSENPGFAEAVVAAGLTWVGPSPASVRAMAGKVEAKALVAAAGVPLVPGGAPEDAAAVGFPLLVKASAGGGGRGMRVVRAAAELPAALDAARREAAAAFGDPTVFVERYLPRARHVEVQVFGDAHGGVVHLFERECSVQRRHQKVVEETPSPGVAPAVLERMYAAAVAAARAVDYVGAGTVEFLVDGGEFFFLEMNTRLQVEHPVTELVTGVDLVEWQLRVAAGEPLPLRQEQVTRSGHAVEARLYAEDPARDYLPGTGVLTRFAVATGGDDPLVRLDAGVEPGSAVTPHYDAMLAKVVCWAGTRERAAAGLARALATAEVAGVATNRDSLVAVLRHPAFGAGDTTTAFLDEHPEVLAPRLDRGERERELVAAALAAVAGAAGRPAPPGFGTVPGMRQLVRLGYEEAGEQVVAAVRHGWTRSGPAVAVLPDPAGEPAGAPGWWAAPDADVRAEVRPAPGGGRGAAGGAQAGGPPGAGDAAGARGALQVSVEVDRLRTTYGVRRDGDELLVRSPARTGLYRVLPTLAESGLEAEDRGPSTPVPGTVTAVAVAPGDAVVAGQVLVVLEAMKMEHKVLAHTDGTVAQVLVAVGQSVDAHQVVAVLADPSQDADGGPPGGAPGDAAGAPGGGAPAGAAR